MKGYVRISSWWYEIAHCVVSTEYTGTRASVVRRAGVGSERYQVDGESRPLSKMGSVYIGRVGVGGRTYT